MTADSTVQGVAIRLVSRLRIGREHEAPGMIITRTPLRISFLGGGTDYPEYFENHGGAVLGTAVDKSAYFSLSRFYSKMFDYSLRIAYRKVECVNSIDELEHVPFRECLRWTGLTHDI